MLWTLGKVVFFLGLIGAAGLGLMHWAEQGGAVRIWLLNQEFTFGPLMVLIVVALMFLAVWLGLKLMGLLWATWRFMGGDETAVSRYFDRNREKRGYAALSEGMVALASGEPILAMARARTAERLLRKPELTLLLTAQAAEAAGDSKVATEAWKSLLGDERTRFAAVRGLMQQKLIAGDRETALKLAERAFALKPKHQETQDLLLKLQAEQGDWKGARITLSEKMRSGGLPRSVYRRRDALLALQEAKTVMDDASSIEAREAAIEANKLSPDLIPAAAIAGRALIENGDKKGAARVLKKAWEAQPHPDLAAAFAGIEKDETPSERVKRFRSLLAIRPDHEESRLTEAELLLNAGEFLQARDALGNLPEAHPTQRSLALLAAAERGIGAPEADLRDLLSRAITAPRGPQWCCDQCGIAMDEWNPTCPACGGFDTLSWREADLSRNPAGPNIAPLILGDLPQEAPLLIEEPVVLEEEAPLPEPPRMDLRNKPEEPVLPPDEILRRSN